MQERQYTWDDAVAATGQGFGGDADHVADEAIEVSARSETATYVSHTQGIITDLEIEFFVTLLERQI